MSVTNAERSAPGPARPGKMPTRLDLDNVFLLVGCTALAAAVPALGVVGLGDPAGSPAPGVTWLATLTAGAALVLFLAHDPETRLRRVWQLLWTLSFALFLVQPWPVTAPARAFLNADPLIVAGAFGKGRSVAFTSDCGPHWAPPPFVEWAGYRKLWPQIAAWAAGRL